MRRDGIIEAMERLREALIDSQVRDVLRMGRSAPPSEDNTGLTQKMLMSYSIFSQHHLNFGEGEKYLMSLFGLTPLINVNFWSGLLDGDRNLSQKMLSDIEVGVYNIVFVMPKFKDLLIRETDKEDVVIKLKDGAEREVNRLRVFVAEKGDSLTDTAVISNVIKAVEELYENFSYMNKTGYVSLAVGSIDSGSSKSFDFFGNPPVIKDVTSIISDVWDKIKFNEDSENVRYQIEVALMAVGFVNNVNAKQTAGVITEEESDRIIRSVGRAIEVLFQNGAYTLKMDKEEESRASAILQTHVAQIEMKTDGFGASSSEPKTQPKDNLENKIVESLSTEPQDVEFVEAS